MPAGIMVGTKRMDSSEHEDDRARDVLKGADGVPKIRFQRN